ncbi:MAG: aminotransferase class V-fold PLP-dependent enzyme, partial [Parvularculaceae bacterium]|nr:aminotransferase class V-fold PLP-dependent enzyme [Parvularculaceae bacterium]
WRAALAPIIGARPGDICPQTNISSALTKILGALPAAPGRRKIALCEEDFPTVGFVFGEARRLGFEPFFVKSGAHLADPDAWAPAFADDVHLVHVTHVFSNLGLLTPVAEIVRRAKEKGVIAVVDAAQSAGAVEVDVGAFNADFVTGTSLKYLCGGAGASWLWVNPDIAPECAPVDVGWFSHENPFEFDIRRFAYAAGANRFWGGTPSVAPYAIARAGLEIIARAGVRAIAAGNQALFDRIAASLPERAFASHVTKGERGSSFIVRPRDLPGARQALGAERIAHDERAGGLRFSVHLYNDESDAGRLLDTLRRFV